MLAKRAEIPRETILVVEDNLDIRALVTMFLQKAGYMVVTADNGEEGLLAFKRHQSSIGLLLTDVMMPAMNGVDLAEHILQLDSHLPVLFMSGDAPRLKLRFGCLEKPFNSADLLDKVTQALQGSDRCRSKSETAREMRAGLTLERYDG
jgi:CheY-like chemotaxis protein